MPTLRTALLTIRDDAHHNRVLASIDRLTTESKTNPSPGKRRQAAANLAILQEMADDYLRQTRALKEGQ